MSHQGQRCKQQRVVAQSREGIGRKACHTCRATRGYDSYARVIQFGSQWEQVVNMSELDKLKKENKQLRALLKNAVELLNQSKKLLKQSDKAKKADPKKSDKPKKEKKTKG